MWGCWWRQILGAGLILLLMWGGIQAARQYGKNMEVPPSYLETGADCSLPCWRGVQPGSATNDEFWQQLDAVQAAGGWMYDGVGGSYDGLYLMEFSLQFRPTPQIRLGDLLLLYGAPQYGRTIQSATLGTSPSPRRAFTEFYLYWADGYVVAVLRDAEFRSGVPLSPRMVVREIRMRARDEADFLPQVVAPWAGLGQVGRYQTD